VCHLVLQLLEVIQQLQSTIQHLEARFNTLEARIAVLETHLQQRSRNSDHPPSSDPPYEKRPARSRSQGKSGAKPGHPGHRQTLLEPTAVIEVKPERCRCGQTEFPEMHPYYTHQVIELPKIQMIMALILRRQDEHLDADGQFATRIAKRLQIEYELITPQKSHYSSAAYLDYLIMNEVATPSLYLFIAEVAAYIRPDMQAVWEGVFPGYTLTAPGQPPGGFAAYLRQACKGWDSRIWQAAAHVFARPLVEQMYEAFRQSLDTEKARYPDDGFGISQFIIRTRTRNRTGPNPLQVYANRVLPFTPGLTKEFWDLVAVIPFEAKADFQLYLDLYQRHFPAARAVPYNSGGKLVKGRRFDPSYYVHRYVAGALYRLSLRYQLRRLGLRGQWTEWWHPSTLVPRVLALVDADHPDLNAPAARMLQRGTRGRMPGPVRALLFYWQTWRWIMEGRLSIQRQDFLATPSQQLTAAVEQSTMR
jgi:hypothetical protein